MKLEMAVTRWLESLEARNVKPGTYRSYQYILRAVVAFAGSATIVSKITRAQLEGFVRTRNGRHPATKAREIGILKMFFSYSLRNDWLQLSPAQYLESPRWTVAERKPYTQAESKAILEACRTPEELALILLMHQTGMRISDAMFLRRDQLREGAIHVQARKNGTELPPFVIRPDLQAALDAIPENGPRYFISGDKSDDCQIREWHRRLHDLYARSQVPGATSHRFRHTFATNVLAHGGSLSDVAAILGITEIVAAKHYEKWSLERRERIRWIMEKVSGTQ